MHYGTYPNLCKSAIALIIIAIISFIIAISTIVGSVASLNPESIKGVIAGVVFLWICWISVVLSFIISFVGMFMSKYESCFIVTFVISLVFLIILASSTNIKDNNGNSVNNVANNIIYS